MLKSLVPYLAAGAGLCFVGYCIYFDRKRRSHPEFRERLRKRRLQQARDAEKASSFPIPPINDPAAMQNFFLQQIQQGELALSLGAVDEGIQRLAVAVAICGKPSKLLQVLQQSLSPSIFIKLVETLPSVQAIPISVALLIFLAPLIDHSHGDRDPYDMFATQKETFVSDLTNPDESQTEQPISVTQYATKPNAELTDLGHYRDLHLVLARILWRNLKLDHPISASNPIKLTIVANLRPEDIQLLNQYCGSNRTLSERVSPDLVNSVFSHLIESVSSTDPTSKSWILDLVQSFQPPGFVIMILVCCVLFILFTIRKKFLGFLLLLVIVLQEMYQKYKTRLAHKMSTMSRYAVDNQCQFPNGQSWFDWMFRGLTSRPKSDECAIYYEQLMSDPFWETSLYDVLLDLFFRPLVNFSAILGQSTGVFYHQLTVYMPFYMVPVFVGLVIVTLVLVGRFVWSFIVRPSFNRPGPNLASRRSNKVRSRSPQLSIGTNNPQQQQQQQKKQK